MKITTRQFGAALVALLMLTSLVGAAAAASWDTEGTNTATTSDVSGASSSATWYAGSTEETEYYEVQGAGTDNLTLEIRNGASELNTTYYTNSSAETTDATNGHYAWNITHAELRSELPSDYQGGTYTVAVVNDSTGDDIVTHQRTLNFNSSKTTARIMVENASRSADAIGNSLVADSLEVSTEETWWGFGADKNVSTYRDDVQVDGDNTTVEMEFKDSSARESMEAAAAGHEDGEWIYGAQFTVSSSTTDTKLAKVYLNEAPSEPGDTYAVYDNSSKRITFHSTEFSDAEELHIRGVANEGYSFGDLWSNFGAQDAFTSWLGA